jgi:hypothetical protein
MGMFFEEGTGRWVRETLENMCRGYSISKLPYVPPCQISRFEAVANYLRILEEFAHDGAYRTG